MKTFNQYLNETTDYDSELENAEPQEYLAAKNSELTGKFFDNNFQCVYYMKKGAIHRENGPAVLYKTGKKDWFLTGVNIKYLLEVPKKVQWNAIKDDINNIEFIKNPTIEIQRYVLERNPYLIDKIRNIYPKLKQQYSDISTTKGLGI